MFIKSHYVLKKNMPMVYTGFAANFSRVSVVKFNEFDVRIVLQARINCRAVPNNLWYTDRLENFHLGYYCNQRKDNYHRTRQECKRLKKILHYTNPTVLSQTFDLCELSISTIGLAIDLHEKLNSNHCVNNFNFYAYMYCIMFKPYFEIQGCSLG